MAENFGKPVDENTPVDPPDPAAKLPKEVVDSIEQGAQAKIFNTLMQDPDYAAVMRMKQQGKKMKISEEGVEPVKQPEGASGAKPAPPSSDLSKMSEQEKMQYLVDQVVGKTGQLVDQKLAPMTKELEQLKGYAQGKLRDETITSVNDVKKKYGESEFEALKPTMAELYQRNQSLSAEELFLLASAKSGKLVQSKTRSASEKPTSTTSRPHVKPEVKNGVTGMRELLQGATARIYSERFGESEE